MTANEYMKKIKDNLDSVDSNLKKISVNPQETKTDSWSIKDVADTFKKHGLIVEQEPTGHWKRISMDKYSEHSKYWYRCDRCGKDNLGNTDWCPNCGCRMVDPQETETWNGYHGQITAPKGTFEKIYEDAESEDKE